MFRCLKCQSEVSLKEEKLSCNSCGENYKFDKSHNIYSIVDARLSSLVESIDADWSNHWKATSSVFHKMKKLMRIYMTGPILSKALKPYLIEKNKVFLEAGSGLSETSSLLNFEDHLYISLDISSVALKKNVNKQIKLQGDLFNIPILSKRIDHVFNVGVHEHYTDDQNRLILKEYHRILRERGSVILLWPKYYGPLMVVAKIINYVMSFLLKKKFEVWPNQINEIRNHISNDNLMNESGFYKEARYTSFYDLFSTQILVYKKS